MTAAATLTVAELAGVLGWSLPDALALLSGPFAPNDDGRLPAGLALGAVVFAELGQRHVLPPELAATVAGAASRADCNGDRCLVLAWRNGQPVLAWRGAGAALPPADPAQVYGAPIRGPHVIVPADHMLADLLHAVVLFRQRDAVALQRLSPEGTHHGPS